MDNDDLRAVRPPIHKVFFGEANAILAGDALLTAALRDGGATRSPAVPPSRLLKVVVSFSLAAGGSWTGRRPGS